MTHSNYKMNCRALAFATVCILIISLLSSVGVFADSPIGEVVSHPFTVIDLPDTYLQRDSLTDHSPFLYSGQYNSNLISMLDTVYDWWLTDGDSMTVRDGTFRWYGDYFVLKGDSNTWQGAYFSSVPEGSFFVGYYDYNNQPLYANYRLYVPKQFIDDNNITAFPMWWGPSMVGTDKYSTFESPNNRTVNVSDTSQLVQIDGEDYYYFSSINTSANNFILATSLPVFVRDNYNFDEISDLGENVNPNYSGGGSDGESSVNNLYFPSSDWHWYCSSYGSAYAISNNGDTNISNSISNTNKRNTWGSGSCSFTAVTTDYQEAHPEEFTVRLKFMLWMKPCYPANQISFDGNAWSVKYVYATNSADYTLDIPLEDFISQGNIQTIAIQDIFENMTVTDTNESYSGSFMGYVRNMREQDYVLFDNRTGLGWKIQATAEILDNSNNLGSGQNQENYDFLSQISKQTNDSLNENEYPYTVSEDDVSSGDMGGSNSQQLTSENGQIILTNNDNDTINIYDGNADVVEDLYSDLTVSDGEDSLPERFTDLVNENAWITIMQDTFSFVPSTIWVTVETFVITILGILAGAFVLRLILDLL